MRRVYLSFLGLGSRDPDTKLYDYNSAVYQLNGRKSRETKFVQVAEMELLGAGRFDLVLIAATQQSFDRHFCELKKQMENWGAVPHCFILEEKMDAEGQWKWFEKILSYIEPCDELTIDLTHGYRAIPIIFSTALNFLQKARNITINAVYYGVWERVKDEGYAPIIDMKDFFLINEWAEGVSRLVEDADARKLGEASKKTLDFQVGELNDEAIIRSFDDLTNAIRNVDINNVGSKAAKAMELIRKKKQDASLIGKILLDLVIDKFVFLSTEEPISGKYDGNYFELQGEIIKMLLEHRLYMQAYTVMREFIASIGMIGVEKANVKSSEGRKKRRRYGDIFVNMVQYTKVEWKFGSCAAQKKNREVEQEDKDWDSCIPFYRRLEDAGVVEVLRLFAKELTDYRNGFDHAWTSKSGAYTDFDSKGKGFFENLEKTIRLLRAEKILQ